MAENKEFYLVIKGEKIIVSEEVYRAYKSSDRAERKRKQRMWRCRKERLMDKTEVNMNVLNKVIAFKLLRILRDNGFIEDGKYANIERKSIQYGESIISQNKLVGR